MKKYILCCISFFVKTINNIEFVSDSCCAALCSFCFSLWCFLCTLVYVCFNTVDCLDPTCSNNGICVNGECHCKPGWGGLHCELPRAQCPDQCHGHGAFIPDTGLCSCDPNWMGPDCSMGEFDFTAVGSPAGVKRVG